MSEWLKKLKETAKNFQRNYTEGDLLGESKIDYDIKSVVFTPGYPEITLDGEFTIAQLEELSQHMKKHLTL